MALISSHQRTRIPIPHEQGQWIEVRPLTVGDSAAVEPFAKDGGIGFAYKLLSCILTDWSYDEPVSEEAIGRLDMETFQWLMESVNVTGGRSEAEKKESSKLSSLPTTRKASNGRGN